MDADDDSRTSTEPASVQIVGNSGAALYLALLLFERKFDVEWVTTGFESQLRPARIRESSLRNLRSLLARGSCNLNCVLDAPELAAWGPLDREAEVSAYPDLSEDMLTQDRWIDLSALFPIIRGLAKGMGIRVVEFSGASLPPPDLRLKRAVVLDVAKHEDRAWPNLMRDGFPDSVKQGHFVRSYALPHLGEQVKRANVLRFAERMGVRVAVEPSPSTQGWVLTLISRSQASLDGFLRELSQLKARAPLESPLIGLESLRTLWLFNSRAGIEEHKWVVSGARQHLFEMPGFYRMGASVGRFAPFSNLQEAESFVQAERLAQRLGRLATSVQPEAFLHGSESWNTELLSEFRTKFNRALFWEKCLFSPRWGRALLKSSVWVPRRIRQALSTPL